MGSWVGLTHNDVCSASIGQRVLDDAMVNKQLPPSKQHSMPVHFFPCSRRHFLAGSAATVAALGQAQLPADESKSEPDSWAVLSDTHLLSTTSIERHYAGNQTAMSKRAMVVSENFNRAARQVRELKEEFAGLILNGDCVHVGGEEEYALLATKFSLLKQIPIHVAMGNHDHRGNFSVGFRKRTRSGDGVLLENRHVSVLKSRHANLVLLDSLTMKTPDRPVKGPGVLGGKQLAWFESVLDSLSDKPAIVMLHHNLDPGEKYQDHFGRQNLVAESAGPFKGLSGGLEDSDQFLDLLHTKPHVKAVVTGHMHQFRIFKWRKICFVSLPSVGYTFDTKEPVAWIRMQLKDGGAGIELHTLDPKHARHQTRVNLHWS